MKKKREFGGRVIPYIYDLDKDQIEARKEANRGDILKNISTLARRKDIVRRLGVANVF